MLHKTTRERYEKLQKVFTRLKNNFNRDDLDDFIQTANSLREWIQRDDTLMPEQKAALDKFIVPNSVDWQICNQTANQQKHVRNANPRKKARTAESNLIPFVKAVNIKPGGTGVLMPASMRIIGAGEEIVFEFDDSHESALGFVIRTFQYFRCIFAVIPAPAHERANVGLADIFD